MLISFPNRKIPALPGPRRVSPGTGSASSLPAAVQMLALAGGVEPSFPLPRELQNTSLVSALQQGFTPLCAHLG